MQIIVVGKELAPPTQKCHAALAAVESPCFSAVLNSYDLCSSLQCTANQYNIIHTGIFGIEEIPAMILVNNQAAVIMNHRYIIVGMILHGCRSLIALPPSAGNSADV